MDILGRILVGVSIPITFALIARYFPRNVEKEVITADGDPSLPFGAAGGLMWLMGLTILVSGFYGLRGMNRVLSAYDAGTRLPLLTVYPESAIWWFFPGFAALLLPWLLTLFLLRRNGYSGQAARIVAKGNAKAGWDGERVMHLLGWFVVLPIGLLTVPALWMHMSVFPDEIHVTHYGHMSSEVFQLAQARRAYWVDGYRLRDGSFQSRPDLVLDFGDGRRLSTNAVGNGGTPSAAMVSLLLNLSHLQAEHVQTQEELP